MPSPSRLLVVSSSLAALLLLPPSPALAQPRAAVADSLTIRDLLDVGNASIQDLTRDGRWLVVSMGTRRDGLGTDQYRTGDPTYVRGALAQYVLIDTRSGERRAIWPGKKAVRSATWSPDGARLAMFVIENETQQLTVWDRASGRFTTAKVPAGWYIAENSELRWSNDSKSIAFSTRSDAWKAKASARFREITKGPIVVLDASDNFLEWEALGRMSSQRAVVSWDLASGAIKNLLPESQINSWTLAGDGSAVVVSEDLTQRTNYEGGGRANRMTAHFPGTATNRVLFPTTQGVQVSWADDGIRYAITRDGRVFVATLTDTTTRQILGATGPASGDGAPGGRGGGGRGGRGGGRGGGGAPAPADTTAAGRAAALAAANERFSVSQWSANGEEILATNRQGYWIVNVATGAKEMIIALPDSGSQEPRPQVTAWTRDGRYLYVTTNSTTEWERSVSRYDRQSKQSTQLVKDSRTYGGLNVSDDGSTVVLTTTPGNRPADIYVADGELKNPRLLVESNPQLNSKPIARTELLTYLDADGNKQYGVLHYPTNYQPGTRYPTVFIIYETYFANSWDPVANLLAARGYAVVKPSVSFETGFPGEAWLKGVTAAANHVIQMGVADSARLGVHGTSYGGYATNLLITQTKRFKAAINISGKVDIISFYTDSPRLGIRNMSAAERSQDRIGATLWEQPQKYVAHSAVMFADRITTPLLLLTGGQDHNVPELNTREMYYALRRLGKTVTWVSYTNGGHGIPTTTETEFIDWHQRVVDWYGKYLKPDVKAAMN